MRGVAQEVAGRASRCFALGPPNGGWQAFRVRLYRFHPNASASEPVIRAVMAVAVQCFGNIGGAIPLNHTFGGQARRLQKRYIGLNTFW
jgi:hypothetical protein